MWGYMRTVASIYGPSALATELPVSQLHIYLTYFTFILEGAYVKKKKKENKSPFLYLRPFTWLLEDATNLKTVI